MTQRKPPRIYSEPRMGCMDFSRGCLIVPGWVLAAFIAVALIALGPWGWVTFVIVGACVVWGKPLLGWLFGYSGRR